MLEAVRKRAARHRSAPFRCRAEPPGKVAAETLNAAYATTEEVLRRFQTSEAGLTEIEAARRLAEAGPNQAVSERSLPAWRRLAANFQHPFILLLSTLGVLSVWLQNLQAGLLILLMVAISVALRFLHEEQSTRIIAQLRALVGIRTTVLRPDAGGGSSTREVPAVDLVPGDIVRLTAGDMVPGDARLLSARDLFVGQSVLTGEALPIEKFESPPLQVRLSGHLAPNVLETRNLCFMGSNVVSGTALALIVATGQQTYFSSIARGASRRRSPTALDRGINELSWWFVRAMLVLVPLVLLMVGLSKGDWLTGSLFALSVAVGLTPEMLPVVLAANLTRGARNLARRRIIAKRLHSLEDVGAMQVLCTDKTGTLTLDRIILEQHVGLDGKPDNRVLEYAYLNSYHQTGPRNLLDSAILEHAELNQRLQCQASIKKVDELPFDFLRRRVSVVLEREGQHELICKGAMENVLEACSTAALDGVSAPLTAALRAEVMRRWRELSSSGLRVLAIAHRVIGPQELAFRYELTAERDLTLVGFLAFLDPPKDTAPEALAWLQAHGIQIKILTGDNEWVARRICQWVRLDPGEPLSGSDVDAMDERALQWAAAQASLFTKLTPLQKARVIAALKRQGYTVGYLGDGINDALALREADIGISVDSAADVAKESADIVLLEKGLMALVELVREGRANTANALKYIRMAASSNFGNVLTVLATSAFLPFLPMLPIQLLIQNLLYDVSQLAIAFDGVDADDIVRPTRWDLGELTRYVLAFGPVSSLFDGVTFLVLWTVLGANSPGRQNVFQSGWFVEGLLSQTFIVLVLRTAKVPFLESSPSPALLATTLLIGLTGAALPLTGPGAALGLVPLPSVYYVLLSLILLGYAALTQGCKASLLPRFSD